MSHQRLMLEKLPKTALSLYVKLYCKRKGDTHSKYHNNLIEATKSWLSLDEEEKQQFTNKLNECRVKLKHRFADYLRNVKPYLKKKPRKTVSNCHQLCNQDVEINEADVLNTKSSQENKNEEDQILVDNVNEMVTDMNKNSWVETFMETEIPEQNYSISEECNLAPLPEPIPPSAKSAKELFEMIKSMDNRNEETWNTLSSKNKQRYRQAVLSLKKDYIIKYKAYLESLPSKQLFEYYNTIIEPYFFFIQW